MKKSSSRVPGLRFQNNRWILSSDFEVRGEEYSVDLVIQYAWNGNSWNEYKKFIFNAGNESELVTMDEYLAHLQCVEDNEGTEEAAKVEAEWINCSKYMVIENYQEALIANNIANSLIQKWEAMLNLGLFSPSVTM